MTQDRALGALPGGCSMRRDRWAGGRPRASRAAGLHRAGAQLRRGGLPEKNEPWFLRPVRGGSASPSAQ